MLPALRRQGEWVADGNDDRCKAACEFGRGGRSIAVSSFWSNDRGGNGPRDVTPAAPGWNPPAAPPYETAPLPPAAAATQGAQAESGFHGVCSEARCHYSGPLQGIGRLLDQTPVTRLVTRWLLDGRLLDAASHSTAELWQVSARQATLGTKP